MKSARMSPVRADVIVVGSGVAGLSVALSLRGYDVLLLTKTCLGEGSSGIWAQGGVAAAMGGSDSPALHAQDTLAVGGGIADPDAVLVLTQEGPDDLRKLIELGVRFDLDGDRLALGREAAHSQARILHAHGDATGAEMVRALELAVCQAPWIAVVEDTSVSVAGTLGIPEARSRLPVGVRRGEEFTHRRTAHRHCSASAAGKPRGAFSGRSPR